jgi:hypothetical protein
VWAQSRAGEAPRSEPLIKINGSGDRLQGQVCKSHLLIPGEVAHESGVMSPANPI